MAARALRGLLCAALIAGGAASLGAQDPGGTTPGPATGPSNTTAPGPGAPGGTGPAPGAGTAGPPSPGADTPRVEATVATISLGQLPPGIGVQGLAISADRTYLYLGQGTATAAWNGVQCTGTPPISGPATGSVGVIDTSALVKVADLPLRSGTPIHVEPDTSTGRIYVAASPFGVYAFDGLREAGAVSLGGAPHDIGIDPAIARGVATNTHDVTGRPEAQTYLSLIDLSTMRVIQHMESGGRGPHKAAVDPQRHLVFVTHAEYPNVDVVETTTGQVLRQIATGLENGGAQNAIDLVRRRLFTGGNLGNGAAVVRIDLDTEQVSESHAVLPYGGHAMRVDPVTGLLWAVLENQASVTVIDPESMSELARVPVGHCPYYLDIDPVRQLAFVTNQGDASVSVVDMTLVPGPTASATTASAVALRALDTQAASATSADGRAIRGLTDAVIDALSQVRLPLGHSVRERLAHAQEQFVRGEQHPIAESAAADAVNALMGRLRIDGWTAVTATDIRTERLGLQRVLPRLIGAVSEGGSMSPAEAVAVTLTLVPSRLAPGARQILADTPASLRDESSDASWLAHAFLTALGLRR